MSAPSVSAVTPSRVDGRRLRSVRTSRLIVEAYLSLLREDPQLPTAVRIAERAGYSVRSVFERFPDLHALRVAAADYAFNQVLLRRPMQGLDGDRGTRIRAYVETRAGVSEEWLPLWRAISANHGDSAALEARIRLVRRTILERLQLSFGPELSTLEAQQRQELLIVLQLLVDFESWGRLREFAGLGVVEARAVWMQAIDRLLPPTPPVS